MAILRGVETDEKEVSGSAFLAAIAEDPRILSNQGGQEVTSGALESLDALYKVETVNLATVRKATAPSGPKKAEESPRMTPEEPLNPISSNEPIGPALDLVSERLSSFVLQEPIQVLRLSKKLEAQLRAVGKERLIHLLEEKQEEVQNKLQKRLGPHFSKESGRVDFEALLRAAFHPLSFSFLQEALKPFGLDSIWATSDRQVYEEPTERFLKEVNRFALIESLGAVFKTFIVPWIQRREGVATKGEIEEKLVSLAITERDTAPIFKLFDKLLGKEWMGEFLVTLEEGVYSSDQKMAEQVKKAEKALLEFFYTEELEYPQEDLLTLVEGALVRRWSLLSRRLLIRTLHSLSRYKLLKRKGGVIYVSLCKSECLSP